MKTTSIKVKKRNIDRNTPTEEKPSIEVVNIDGESPPIGDSKIITTGSFCPSIKRIYPFVLVEKIGGNLCCEKTNVTETLYRYMCN